MDKKMLLIPLALVLLSIPAVVSASSKRKNYGYRLVGDFNHDCIVDWFDFGTFASRYASDRGDNRYRGWADLNKDGSVDRYDFGIFAQVYWSEC